MLQNLSKGKMVEWVVLLVALVTLGLSIAALAKPCSSNFGDTCQRMSPYLSSKSRMPHVSRHYDHSFLQYILPLRLYSCRNYYYCQGTSNCRC